jgi:hypothetical protein
VSSDQFFAQPRVAAPGEATPREPSSARQPAAAAYTTLVANNSGPSRLAIRGRRRIIFAIAGALAMSAVGVAAWSFGLRDRFVPKRFGVVVPGEIYRSGQISRSMLGQVIDRYHIGTIVDLNGYDPTDRDQQAEVAICRSKGVQHNVFPLKGNGTGPITRYADALEKVVHSQQNGIPALVHCYAGTQRTGGFVSFYRLLIRHERPEDVYAELVRYGWDSGTDQVLLEYINSNMRTMAELLVQRHVLDRLPAEMPRLHP